MWKTFVLFEIQMMEEHMAFFTVYFQKRETSADGYATRCPFRIASAIGSVEVWSLFPVSENSASMYEQDLRDDAFLAFGIGGQYEIDTRGGTSSIG